MKLYELTSQMQKLERLLEESGGEVTQLAEQAFIELGDSIDDKLDAIGRLVRCWETEALGLKDEEQRLAARRKSLESRAEGLLNYIGLCLGHKNSKKTKYFSFTWRNSKAVEIDDEDLIPQAYKRVKYEPDKAEIKKAIENKANIPGCRLVERFNLQFK